MSLRLQKVPLLWKTSCLVPVPKTPHQNDRQQKSLAQPLLRPMVKPFIDPLQFAYQHHLGVDDAIIFLLNRADTHLDKAASMVRVMFFDFSCAFNTIRPALLSEKLTAMQVDTSLVYWIVNYLTGRPQYVRLQHCVSDRVVSNIGAPQGTVLSTFLFALWCELNHLQLNVTKTKELVVDLRRKKTQGTPISIQGAPVDIVEDYKYLGVYLNNKLDWTKNSEAVYRKG
ncbi:hypothetical protein N1851_002315 [Merluccius polli]|uniref:Reverse transcriptase domain-containing protein n=1 Tax=Merluccius polli TaxID=89951 RepID=A0AA47PCD1_MERPO|nr:hypothetical protein N1851_002315 [Merluccius polli]